MRGEPSITEAMVLGTAQLGMDYGITNLSGRPGRKAAFDILTEAWERGIVRFDTAPGYGSEELLGEFTRANGIGDSIRVLTKIPSLRGISNHRASIERTIDESLRKLASSNIEVLFFHDAADSELLIRDPDFFHELTKTFPVSDIGVSIYSPDEVDHVINCGLSPAVQFPLNVLDRRFSQVAMPAGKRYARSVFLQGLLAADTGLKADIPEPLRKLQHDYFHQLAELGLDPLFCAISFVASSANVDYFLIGVESKDQLVDIVMSNQSFDPGLESAARISIDVDPEWLDPRRWNQTKT